jgi:hypothetical protein
MENRFTVLERGFHDAPFFPRQSFGGYGEDCFLDSVAAVHVCDGGKAGHHVCAEKAGRIASVDMGTRGGAVQSNRKVTA